MGILVRLPKGALESKVSPSVRESSASTIRNVAAAGPMPLALAEKIPGATGATCTTALALWPAALVTATVAWTGAVSGGIRKFNCPGATNDKRARRSTPRESVTVTSVPPSEVGRGTVSSDFPESVPPAGDREYGSAPASGDNGDDVLDTTLKAAQNPLSRLRLRRCGEGSLTVFARGVAHDLCKTGYERSVPP